MMKTISKQGNVIIRQMAGSSARICPFGTRRGWVTGLLPPSQAPKKPRQLQRSFVNRRFVLGKLLQYRRDCPQPPSVSARSETGNRRPSSPFDSSKPGGTPRLLDVRKLRKLSMTLRVRRER